MSRCAGGPFLYGLWRPEITGRGTSVVWRGHPTSNLPSSIDFLPLMVSFGPVTFAAKSEYFTGTGRRNARPVRAYLRATGRLPVDRKWPRRAGMLDSALGCCGRAVRDLPRGTRSPDGRHPAGCHYPAGANARSGIPVAGGQHQPECCRRAPFPRSADPDWISKPLTFDSLPATGAPPGPGTARPRRGRRSGSAKESCTCTPRCAKGTRRPRSACPLTKTEVWVPSASASGIDQSVAAGAPGSWSRSTAGKVPRGRRPGSGVDRRPAARWGHRPPRPPGRRSPAWSGRRSPSRRPPWPSGRMEATGWRAASADGLRAGPLVRGSSLSGLTAGSQGLADTLAAAGRASDRRQLRPGQPRRPAA